MHNKAAINIQDNSGITPLHLAVIEGDLPMVGFLLARGADGSIPDKGEITALEQADIQGSNAIFKLIQQDLRQKRLRAQVMTQSQASLEPEFGIS